MIFIATPIPGAFLIELEPHADERGFLARTFCADEFAQHGLDPRVAQCCLTRTTRKGTLRGLHWQEAPHAEAKLIRCLRGAVFDVIVDVRADSPAFCRWSAFELSAENHRELYLPAGCAHGLQTLTDDVEMFYQMSEPYRPELQHGARWDDPAFGIQWPHAERVISARDLAFPDFRR